MNKWMIGLLLCSAALNVLFVGFLFGRSIANFGAGPGDPMVSYRYFVRSLPETRREELRATLRKGFGSQRPHLRTLREQQRELRELIRAEPFSAAQLHATLRDMQATHQTLQHNSHAAFVELVGSLTTAERQALADDMRNPPRRGPPHRRSAQQ